MATYYGTNAGKVMAATVNTGAPGTPAQDTTGSSVRAFVETVAMTTQTTGDIIYVARLPKGSVFLYGLIDTDTTTSTATVSVGVTGATQKYRTAGAVTVTTQPGLLGVGAAWTQLTQDDDVFLTIGTASLPTSGNLTVTMVYAFN